MRGAILLLLAFLAAAPVQAQSVAGYSRMGFGARGVGMGNALAADSTASPFYNPALAPFAEQQSLTASVGMLSMDRDLQFVQLASPLQRAGIAIGLTHAVVSGIDGRNNDGYHTTTYETSDFAGFLAFGLRFSSRVTAGIGLQLFRSDLIDGLGAVNTVGLDFGVTARVTDDLRLAFVADDLLARFTWDSSGLYSSGGKSTTDNFPRRLRLAAAHAFMDGQLLAVAELESRFTTVETLTTSVRLLGDSPVQTTTAEELTLRQDLVRAGVRYAAMEYLDVFAGLDRTAGGAGGAFRPALGFSLTQPVGSLTSQLGYTFAAEPYGMGSAHYLSLRLYLD
ncbi:MAG: hypothetical protein JJ896_12165 [Rhodothermales bacterium]|nr:hypothetical protein [Rhodothermales bacterium]MBO6780399.1 hypothetical protein [Rhodothermales bacterium]